jgi:1-aminocyclopropane-1-carboxylate deaminase
MLDEIMLQPTPVQEVRLPSLDKQGVRLLIKRDDLIHPHISGNKWRKLKYNIMQLTGKPILTFGGAYSNHVRAVAAVTSILGIGSTGVIRGEPGLPLNPVLGYVKKMGMRLHCVDRSSYRRREEPDYVAELLSLLGPHHVVPEGGRNAAGIRGCREILPEVEQEYDAVYCAVGTGTTLAGLIAELPVSARAVGIPVLKGGEFLKREVRDLLILADCPDHARWGLETEYHFGGYGKRPSHLCAFTEQLSRDTQIPFEPVYTGKLMYGLLDNVTRGDFRRGDTILAIHTGGVLPPS